MKQHLRRISGKLLPKQVVEVPVPQAINEYALLSFSQEGEDMVLRRLVKDKAEGFYVDVGAHHPTRFSNTYYFYQKGWRGINIDADPDLMDEFHAMRPRDINLAHAVGIKESALLFYVFNERAINTFDKSLAQKRAKINGYEIVERRKIPVLPLDAILETHLPKGQKIDFMSIDVEGKDLEVLKTNDWKKYRPSFLLVECLKVDLLVDIAKDPVTKYLKTKGYVPVSKAYNTVIFADEITYAGK